MDKNPRQRDSQPNSSRVAKKLSELEHSQFDIDTNKKAAVRSSKQKDMNKT